MKVILFSLSLFMSINGAWAQSCTRTISQFQAATGGYAINGTATLVQQPDGTLKLTLSNTFSTTAGPDLHLYLAQKLESPANSGNANIDISALQAAAGTQTYTISGVKLGAYPYLLVHCKTFNHLWGGGLLGTATGSCSPTANEADLPEQTTLQVYPNPVKDGKLFLSENGRVQVLDILGREVIPTHPISSPVLDVSALPRGAYILRINEVIIRKIIVQ